MRPLFLETLHFVGEVNDCIAERSVHILVSRMSWLDMYAVAPDRFFGVLVTSKVAVEVHPGQTLYTHPVRKIGTPPPRAASWNTLPFCKTVKTPPRPPRGTNTSQTTSTTVANQRMTITGLGSGGLSAPDCCPNDR